MRVLTLKGKEAAGSVGITWNRHAGTEISKHVKTMLNMIPWSLLVATERRNKGLQECGGSDGFLPCTLLGGHEQEPC